MKREDHPKHEPPPAAHHDEQARRLLHQIIDSVDWIEHALARIERKLGTLMAHSQAQTEAFADLVATIDQKFNDAQAPLVAELRSQIETLQADDNADQAEIDRLTALVDTAEAEVLAAVADVKSHVSALGEAPVAQ